MIKRLLKWFLLRHSQVDVVTKIGTSGLSFDRRSVPVYKIGDHHLVPLEVLDMCSSNFQAADALHRRWKMANKS